MCFSVSAGWRGGLRHYPDPVAAPDLQQAGEQQPHLSLQAQQPRQYLLSFHFLFLLPVFYFRLFLPLFPLSLTASRIPLPVSPPISDFLFSLRFMLPVSYIRILLPLSCFRFSASSRPRTVIISISFYSVPRYSISL
jgi:hypothetical protein